MNILKNELNRIPTEDSIEVRLSTNKIMSIILAGTLCVIAIYLGIAHRASIIATLWLVIIFVLTVIITFKIESAIYKRWIFGGVFVLLFLLSLLIYFIIYLIGLDIMKWTF